MIVICEECIKNMNAMYEIAKYKCIYVSEQVFNTMTDVTNPQGILAVVKRKKYTNNIDLTRYNSCTRWNTRPREFRYYIKNNIDSANLNQVILSKQTADCYNPKEVVRSTMGGIFRINVIQSRRHIKKI